MSAIRTIGLSHCYFDSRIEGFSNVAVGLLIRAIGHGLKVAYVDVGGKGTKFTNFIENLSLSYSFVKRFDRLRIDLYTFKVNDKVSKTLIPLVEFYTINSEMFWKGLNEYDLVIFDNIEKDSLSKFKIISFIENKAIDVESVFVFSDEKSFNDVKDNFNLVSIYNYNDASKGLILKQNIINITGDGKGKSTYGFGHLIRSFISKKDVKLVYFDKGGDFYGEMKFFEALKRWAVENNLYGKFDFVATGLRRFDGQKFRFDNTEGDIREAKEGLMLFKTALKKQTPVIAEELNTTVKTGLLNVEDIVAVLKEAQREVIITGRYSPKEIIDISAVVVEVEEIKHYAKNGHGVRRGIDF